MVQIYKQTSLEIDTTKEIRLTECYICTFNLNYLMVYILSWKFSIHRDTCHIDVIYLHKDYFKGRLNVN